MTTHHVVTQRWSYDRSFKIWVLEPTCLAKQGAQEFWRQPILWEKSSFVLRKRFTSYFHQYIMLTLLFFILSFITNNFYVTPDLCAIGPPIVGNKTSI